MEKRERFGSKLGFILLSAGSAIGLGNIWKFPMTVGNNGGGAFVLIYLICLIIIGVPALIMEYALGRASQTVPIGMYKKLAPDKKGWTAQGYASLIGNIVVLMFYMTIAGWVLKYAGYSLMGEFAGKTTEEISMVYNNMMDNPAKMLLFTTIVAIITGLICFRGLNGGIEKIVNYMMIVLFVLLVGMMIYSFTLDGAREGMEFYLKPDFSKITWKTVSDAMSQALFTLSVGIGTMAVFGSYVGKEKSLLGESVKVVFLDTFVAIVSGIIVFSACFTYGIKPDSGPGLLFKTLPMVFGSFSGGSIWAGLFFILVLLAAVSSIIAIMENIIAQLCAITKWKRVKVTIIACIGLVILNIPMILGCNVWSGFKLFGVEGKSISDWEDFIVSNILMPTGVLTYIVFCTTKVGWGKTGFLAEVNAGKGIKVKNWMFLYIKFALPVLIFTILVVSLINFFNTP